jgi:hypothetical protein
LKFSVEGLCTSLFGWSSGCVKIDAIDQLANLSLVSKPLSEEVLAAFVLDIVDE